MLNRQGRPSAPQAHGVSDPAAGMGDQAARMQGDVNTLSTGSAGSHPTFTGNRALAQEEPLIFEIGRLDCTGVDLDGAAARVESSRAEGVVRGSLEGLLYLENLDADAVVNPGDVVVTSGLGGSYAPGLIIGTGV